MAAPALLIVAIITFGPGFFTVDREEFAMSWAQCLGAREVIARAPHRPDARSFVYCDDSPEAFARHQQEARNGRP
jgi:hypothetical protein